MNTINPFETYSLYFDGASKGNPGPASFGFLIKFENKTIFEEFSKLPDSTNNFAEYSALCEGLKKCRDLGISYLNVYGDSSLVINQMSGKWSLKSQNLLALNTLCNDIKKSFNVINFNWIPRNENKEADALANKAF